MKIGYIRTVAGGLTIEQQKGALASAGLDVSDLSRSVFIGDRAAAISSLNARDELVIAEPACLATNAADALQALAEIGSRSASVIDLSSGTAIAWHPDAQAVLDFAVAADRAARSAKAAQMRKGRLASGNLGQAPFDWTPERLAKLRQLEKEGETRKAQAEALGCSRATLQRKLREMVSKESMQS
ncbi:hypothetical protein [uncultured Tateyamaria sp.]|uniref:hypothetical protein n=1 Tax=uncultured Tateyamaria sp. TaxID=455651 RepID=UPI00263842FA|nr:hypothetical protein [uncultured Tateyamaria sp.]